MKKINLNELARKIATVEGGRQNLSIAQIKEVLRIAILYLGEDYQPSQVLELLERSS